MMAKRAAGNQAYFGKVADTISPAQQSGTLGGELQTTAQDALDAARKSGNAQAAPAYAASSNNPAVKIPSSAWNGLASDPAVAWALQKVKDNPLGGLQNAQEGSLQWLDAAKKFLDEQGENLSNAQPGADRNRYFGGNAKAASKLITSTVDPLVPEYAQARQIVSDNLKNVVTPMQQSPVGKLTRSDDFAQQAGTLLPEKPMDQGPGVTANVVKTLTAQDPSIVRRFTAQYLRDMMNEANQQGSGGLNVRGGANFAGKVAGNPTQESNLMTAVNGGGAPINPLAQALESFRAQGMKPEVNSATTTNAAESGALNKTSLWAYHPIMAAGAAIPAAIDKLRLGIGAKEMAKALAAPDSVGEIMKMARANGTYSPMKQQILANLLNATRQTAATPGPSQ